MSLASLLVLYGIYVYVGTYRAWYRLLPESIVSPTVARDDKASWISGRLTHKSRGLPAAWIQHKKKRKKKRECQISQLAFSSSSLYSVTYTLTPTHMLHWLRLGVPLLTVYGIHLRWHDKKYISDTYNYCGVVLYTHMASMVTSANVIFISIAGVRTQAFRLNGPA